MLSLLIGETDVKPFGGRDKELVQGTLLFHVEHLREMTKEVKDHFTERGNIYGAEEFARRIGQDRCHAVSFETSRARRATLRSQLE